MPGHTAGWCVALCLFAQIRIKPSFLSEILVNLAKIFLFLYFGYFSDLIFLFTSVSPVSVTFSAVLGPLI